jgi:hypothetical protein
VTAATYLIGALSTIAFLALLAAAAVLARRRLMPQTTGAARTLGELVLAVTLAILLPEALGTAEILGRGSLLAGAGAVVAVLWCLPSGRVELHTPPDSRAGARAERVAARGAERLVIGLGLLVLAVVGLQWLAWSIEGLSRGPLGIDTLRYHLPLAARIAHGANPFGLQFLDQDLLSTYDPLNAEMLHTDALTLLGNDALSPVVNLLWLSMAGLAGWVAGQRQRVQWPALLALGATVAVPLLVQGDGGGAENDLALVALLLTSIALVVAEPERVGAVAVSGLAAGLALGSKYAAVGPVVIVLVLLPWLVPGPAAMRLAAWGLPALLTGGFWYLRNWVHTGSPVPELSLSLGPLSLPHVHDPVLALSGYSVSHYLGDGWFWRQVVIPGLPQAFGRAWWLVLGLVALGILVALIRGPGLARALAVMATVSVVSYVFTPYGAGGPEGDPWLFVPDLRFLLPGTSLGLLALALTGQGGHRRGWRIGLLGLLVLTVAAEEWLPSGPYSGWPSGGKALAAVVALAVGLGIAVAVRRATWRWGWLPVSVILLAALLAGGYALERQYVAHRYATMPLAQWAARLHGARIGEIGEPLVYGLYGTNAANQVTYLEPPNRHGDLVPATSCSAWASELRRVDPRYVVIGRNTLVPRGEPQVAWTRRVAPVRELLAAPDGTVVLRLSGPVRPDACGGPPR